MRVINRSKILQWSSKQSSSSKKQASCRCARTTAWPDMRPLELLERDRFDRRLLTRRARRFAHVLPAVGGRHAERLARALHAGQLPDAHQRLPLRQSIRRALDRRFVSERCGRSLGKDNQSISIFTVRLLYTTSYEIITKTYIYKTFTPFDKMNLKKWLKTVRS